MFRRLQRMKAVAKVQLGVRGAQAELDLLNVVANLDDDWNYHKGITRVRGTMFDIAEFLQAKYGVALQPDELPNADELERWQAMRPTREQLQVIWTDIARQLLRNGSVQFERDW